MAYWGLFSIYARKHRDFESRRREVGRLDIAGRLEGAALPATMLLPAPNKRIDITPRTMMTQVYRIMYCIMVSAAT